MMYVWKDEEKICRVCPCLGTESSVLKLAEHLIYSKNFAFIFSYIFSHTCTFQIILIFQKNRCFKEVENLYEIIELVLVADTPTEI